MKITRTIDGYAAYAGDALAGLLCYRKDREAMEIVYCSVQPEHPSALARILNTLRGDHAPVTIEFEAAEANDAMQRLVRILKAQRVHSRYRLAL